MNKSSNKFIRDKLILTALITTVAVVVFAVISRLVSENQHSSNGVIIASATLLGAAVIIIAAFGIYFVHIHALKELENLEHVTESLSTMAILWDPSFEYIRVNNSLIRTTGYTNEDVKDPEIIKKLLPPDAFSENLQAIINNRDEEFFIQAKNGSSICTVWNTSVAARISTRKENHTIMLSIGPNLSEVYKMRSEIQSFTKKLAKSERRYALSMDLSEIGLLLNEKDSSRFYCSNRLCDMLGVIAQDGYVDGDAIRERFHPKDRIVFDTFVSDLKSNKEKNTGGRIHSVEFRAQGTDGIYHWFNFRYKSVADEDSFCHGGAVIDITSDKEKDLMIERMAYIDDVTQIYNRNKFMQIGKEILECTNNDKNINYWVIVIDIDSFHIINDTCGYANGDRLLKEIASVLTSNLSEGGFNARIGGDNFALIVKANDDENYPIRLVKRIQQDIAGIGGMGLETQNITCSAGYCLMSDGDQSCDFAQVLDRAEFALSLSDGTRNAILRFDNHAHDAIIAGNEIEKELSKALENHELVLYYQPKINLENGRVIGMEALIRWIKPDGTIVPPSDFIPVAENSMLITEISRFVLYEACRQNKQWQDMGLEPVTVSINLTAIDFYQTNVTESIQRALDETGLSPKYLDVELTESLALKDIDHAVMQMKEIKDLGVKLSMDDFGTGYSSLSYIQILPITILKLDRSFIMYLEEDEISREIVSAVIRIAKSKRIETIAEGIETQGQAEILKKSGCDHAQGYFFGKPMPADKFEEFLRSRQPVKTK